MNTDDEEDRYEVMSRSTLKARSLALNEVRRHHTMRSAACYGSRAHSTLLLCSLHLGRAGHEGVRAARQHEQAVAFGMCYLNKL